MSFSLVRNLIGWAKNRTSNGFSGEARRFTFEHLENRRMLSINWVNQSTNNFAAVYGANDASIATSLVARAITDWERAVIDFNYDGDGNPLTNNVYNLTVNAGFLGSGVRGSTAFATVNANGLPTATTITMDDNGAGTGWFFDTTSLDDIEFTSIANPFQASFIDSTTFGQTHQNDFYRTIVHEIGHALGITGNPNAAFAGMLTPLVNSAGQPIIDPTGFSGTQL
jgi:hypothetical protein